MNFFYIFLLEMQLIWTLNPLIGEQVRRCFAPVNDQFLMNVPVFLFLCLQSIQVEWNCRFGLSLWFAGAIKTFPLEHFLVCSETAAGIQVFVLPEVFHFLVCNQIRSSAAGRWTAFMPSGLWKHICLVEVRPRALCSAVSFV